MLILLRDDQSVGSTQGEQHIRRTFGKIKVRPQRVRVDAGIVLQPGKQIKMHNRCRHNPRRIADLDTVKFEPDRLKATA